MWTREEDEKTTINAVERGRTARIKINNFSTIKHSKKHVSRYDQVFAFNFDFICYMIRSNMRTASIIDTFLWHTNKSSWLHCRQNAYNFALPFSVSSWVRDETRWACTPINTHTTDTSDITTACSLLIRLVKSLYTKSYTCYAGESVMKCVLLFCFSFFLRSSSSNNSHLFISVISLHVFSSHFFILVSIFFLPFLLSLFLSWAY